VAEFYFTKKDNLVRFTESQLQAVRDAIKVLDGKTPCKFYTDIDRLEFYEDKGMNMDNGVMGKTSFLRSKEVYISPSIAQGLVYKDRRGIPNNETSVAIVIHELTHTQQMKSFGLGFLIFNIPLIDRITIERWADKNQNFTESFLLEHYRKLRERSV